MVDVAQLLGPRAAARTETLERLGVRPGEYVLATAHRAGNVDDPARLERLVALLEAVPLPVVLPLHPRTARAARRRRAARAAGARRRRARAAARLPRLHRAAASIARAVLTDSGGVQKEAYLAGVPCVTLRREHGVDRDGRGGLERARSISTPAPPSRRWSAARPPSARRSTATAARASGWSRRSPVGWARDHDQGRRGRARLLGPEPRPQLRGDRRLRARLALRRATPAALERVGASLPARAPDAVARRPARRRGARRGRAGDAGPDPRRARRARARAPASTASSRSRWPRPSRVPSARSRPPTRPGAC